MSTNGSFRGLLFCGGKSRQLSFVLHSTTSRCLGLSQQPRVTLLGDKSFTLSDVSLPTLHNSPFATYFRSPSPLQRQKHHIRLLFVTFHSHFAHHPRDHFRRPNRGCPSAVAGPLPPSFRSLSLYLERHLSTRKQFFNAICVRGFSATNSRLLYFLGLRSLSRSYPDTYGHPTNHYTNSPRPTFPSYDQHSHYRCLPIDLINYVRKHPHSKDASLCLHLTRPLFSPPQDHANIKATVLLLFCNDDPAVHLPVSSSACFRLEAAPTLTRAHSTGGLLDFRNIVRCHLGRGHSLSA